MSEAPEQVGDYQIIRPLGVGSQGETFLAHDQDDAPVVLKRFSIREMRSWKSLELFQREIATLNILAHPAIPTFLDDLEFDGSHYLVQEFIDGDVLSDLVARGPMAPDEVLAVARDVLEVLEYLHELAPPVVHRDVKPSNIIRRPDGKHALVDFGGVQMIVARDTGGSTVVGTTGYMPSEQLIGRAEPRSDLYALGATLAHLATGIHPSELPTRRLRLDWRDQAPEVPERLAELIDAMLNPAPEDRPASARAAAAALAADAMTTPAPSPDTDLTTVSSDVARMERRMRRTPHFVQLVVASGQNRGVFFGAFIGLLLCAVVVGIKAIVLKVAIGVALLTVAGLARDLFTESELLVVQAGGQAEARTTDAKGRSSVLRGTLKISNGQLYIKPTDGRPTAVAASLTPEQAAWFAHEVDLFMESAQREMHAEASIRQHPLISEETEPTSMLEVDEPAAPPEVELVAALPDRESFFDLQVAEDTSAQISTDRPEFERLDLVYRPDGLLTRGALGRHKTLGSGAVFDLSTHTRVPVARSVKLAIAGVVLAIIAQNSAVAVIAFTAAVVWFLAAVFFAHQERLTVFRDRQFNLRLDDGAELTGRLLPEVRVDGRHLFVLTEDGEKIEFGGEVPRRDRIWIGFLIHEALNRDVV